MVIDVGGHVTAWVGRRHVTRLCLSRDSGPGSAPCLRLPRHLRLERGLGGVSADVIPDSSLGWGKAALGLRSLLRPLW